MLAGRHDWGTSIIRRNERPFVFLSDAMGRFPPSSLSEYWCRSPPWVVLFFNLCLRVYVLQQYFGFSCGIYEYWAVCRLGLFCFYLLLFRSLLGSPLFPFALLFCVGPYSVLFGHGFGGRGRCTLLFWRWSFCIHIRTRMGVQTNLTRHGWKELIHVTPRSKPLGACAVRWMAGWCICVLCYHPATTNPHGPSNPRMSYVWYHIRKSPDYRIMFSKKKGHTNFVNNYLICSCAEISSESNDRGYYATTQ